MRPGAVDHRSIADAIALVEFNLCHAGVASHKEEERLRFSTRVRLPGQQGWLCWGKWAGPSNQRWHLYWRALEGDSTLLSLAPISIQHACAFELPALLEAIAAARKNAQYVTEEVADLFTAFAEQIEGQMDEP